VDFALTTRYIIDRIGESVSPEMRYLIERMTFDQLFRVSDPRRVMRSGTVRGPAIEVLSYQDSEMYVFNAKSSPSTTGLRHKCYIRFYRPRRPKTLQNLDCLVDCECPDYKFRWAWVNKQRGSSAVGSSSLNQAHNRAPRVTNPGNRPGLCKHLLAMRDFIYGQYAQFSDAPDDSRRLDQLTRRAQRRWVDYTGAILQQDIRAQMNRNLGAARRAAAERERQERENQTNQTNRTNDQPEPPPPGGPDELADSLVLRDMDRIVLDLFEEAAEEIKEMSPDQEALELLRQIAAGIQQLVADETPEPAEMPNEDETDVEDLEAEADEQLTDDKATPTPRPVR
jgi:hypothetical protein